MNAKTKALNNIVKKDLSIKPKAMTISPKSSETLKLTVKKPTTIPRGTPIRKVA